MAPNTVIRKVCTRPAAAIALLLSALGCAPQLLPPADDGATGSTGDEDDTGSDATGDTDQADGESSSGGEPTDMPPTGLCLHGTALTTIPESYQPLAVVDNDGDGRDELWAVDASSIAVLQSDGTGQLELSAEHVVDGSIRHMADVDGDGLHDVLILADGPQPAWLAGMPELELGTDPMVLGLLPPVNHRGWIDLDGDGAIDFVEWLQGVDSLESGGFRVHMGDGTGGFVPGQELWVDFRIFSSEVYDTGIPGRPVFRMEEFQSEWGGPSEILAVQMEPSGTFDVVARQFPSLSWVEGAGDFDDNGVPDLVGYDPFAGRDIILAQGQLDGSFELSIEDASVEHMVVTELDGDDAGHVDLLYWDDTEVWLRRGTGEGFAAPEPVTRTGAVGSMTTSRPMQADGSGGREVLVRMSGVEGSDYALQALGPCG